MKIKKKLLKNGYISDTVSKKCSWVYLVRDTNVCDQEYFLETVSFIKFKNLIEIYNYPEIFYRLLIYIIFNVLLLKYMY